MISRRRFFLGAVGSACLAGVAGINVFEAEIQAALDSLRIPAIRGTVLFGAVVEASGLIQPIRHRLYARFAGRKGQISQNQADSAG
jgi:hypothetical protein